MQREAVITLSQLLSVRESLISHGLTVELPDLGDRSLFVQFDDDDDWTEYSLVEAKNLLKHTGQG